MFDQLRQFLQEVPLLTQAIEMELANEPPASSNSDDIRHAQQAAAGRAAEFLREEQLPYAIVLYPDVISRCTDCGTDLAGAYWELNNPSGKGMTIPLKVFHRFVEHGECESEDPITNLAGTKLGTHRMTIDLAGIRSVLEGIPLPPEVSQELAGIAS